MRIDDLPQFTIRWYDEEAGELHGVFDTLEQVEQGWSCLLQPTLPLQGELKQLNPARNTAVFELFADEPGTLAPGMVFAWIPRNYDGPIACAVADLDHVWVRRLFEVSDADSYHYASGFIWRKVGGPALEGAEYGGVIPGGWDHEHCVICNASIDAEQPECYVDADDLWLCPECYHRYAVRHDLGFAVAG